MSYSEYDIVSLSTPADVAPELNCIIYFLIKNKTVVYVGKSKRGITRILNYWHRWTVKRNSKLVIIKPQFDSYFLLPCNKEKLSQMEKYYIEKLCPKYNKQHNANGKCCSDKFIH